MNGFAWTWCFSIVGCCLVIIDLKIGGLAHADIGQMNVYCNFAREHWTQIGENPPVGLILSTDKDDGLAHYAMEGLHNKMLVREYRTALPKNPPSQRRSPAQGNYWNTERNRVSCRARLGVLNEGFDRVTTN